MTQGQIHCADPARHTHSPSSRLSGSRWTSESATMSSQCCNTSTQSPNQPASSLARSLTSVAMTMMPDLFSPRGMHAPRATCFACIHFFLFYLLDRPFCERSILCFAHVSFFFFPYSLFPTSANRNFRNFPTWRGFTRKRSAAMPISWKCPLTKMRGEKPQISPNLASNRTILCALTRNVEGK